MRPRDPKVSVCITTYNHERFIREAVGSALSQDTDFPFEIVVGEDHGTDGTRGELERLHAAHPDRIRLHFRESNLGGNRNFVETLKSCRGEYVAVLDGDDYWLSPRKLQLQADFLDAHPHMALCGHRYRFVFSGGNGNEERVSPAQKSVLGLEDVLRGCCLAACTMMFRRAAVPEVPSWYFEHVSGDRCLQVLCALQGGIGFVDEIMSAYRVHPNGIWGSLSPAKRSESRIALYRFFKDHLGGQYHPVLNRGISQEYKELSWVYGNQGDFRRARESFKNGVATSPSMRWASPESLRWILWLTLPRPYRWLRDRVRSVNARTHRFHSARPVPRR